MIKEVQITKVEKKNIVKDERGASFIEKLIIVGLFALAVAAGISTLAEGANDKLEEQNGAVGEVNAELGGGEG